MILCIVKQSRKHQRRKLLGNTEVFWFELCSQTEQQKISGIFHCVLIKEFSHAFQLRLSYKTNFSRRFSIVA